VSSFRLRPLETARVGRPLAQSVAHCESNIPNYRENALERGGPYDRRAM
jgi:hypothetical protein